MATNTTRIRLAAAFALALTLPLAACASATPAKPLSDVVTVWEGEAVPNIVPPQRLDVRIPADGGDASLARAWAVCEHMGGTPAPVTPAPYVRCYGVDY